MGKGQIKKMTWVERIKTWKLEEDKNKQAFKEMVHDRYTQLQGTSNENWEPIKNILIKPDEEVCGKGKGGKGKKKETRFWNDEL